ncbi:MAG: ABC transporter ATP-binding protein [Pseudonocardiaceae bacterium]
MQVDAESVVVDINGVRIVSAGVLHAAAGSIVGLIGPNGSGKSTLLRTVYRALRPTEGVVRVGGDAVWAMTARQAARRTAVLTQESPIDFDFSVIEIVMLGRVPHKGLLQRADVTDERIIDDALRRSGAAGLAQRRFSTLSGGEKQKVLIARALAQQPKVLVLDEPTNHLDIAAQLELLELVRSLQITVVTALHDLNLAATYCDQLFVLDQGHVTASGTPEEVLVPETLRHVFGVRAHCSTHPLTGRRLLAFAPSAASTAGPELINRPSKEDP